MARVPDAELERLKAEVSLVRLVEAQGVELRKHGPDLIGCCPFHDDRDPSFVVSVSKNLWCCHGACQVGGSVVDFVMRAEGVSFRHAVDLLRQGVGVTDGAPVKESTVVKMPLLARADVEDQELLDRVVGFYADTLRETPDALRFLARRRIDHPDAITAFRLGFADRSLGYRLPAKNRRDGADLRGRLQALGILRATGHEHFRGSLVIPVLNADGQVTEVYGRKIGERLRDGTPKHLYLPGPHRGVWNPAAFTAGDEVIVAESLIDALSLWCWGFRHVTAAFGTEGFGPDLHAAITGHSIRRVVLAFDNDPAGNTAATKIAGRLLEAGVEVFRLNLPAGADVNDVVVAADDPTDTLGRLLRTASWMGAGTPPARRREAPVLDAHPAVIEPELEADGEAVDVEVEAPALPPAPVPPTDPVAPGLVSPAAVSDEGPVASVDDRELTISFGERRWRVRGLAKVTTFDLLRVNVLVAIADRFHVDTLDLYSARARSAFCQMAGGTAGRRGGDQTRSGPGASGLRDARGGRDRGRAGPEDR